MKEELFWGTIEMAWEGAGGCHATRQQLALGDGAWNDRIERLLDEILPKVIEALRSALESAEREELLDFARLLGERLRALDQPELLRRSRAEEGVGFLYARSFVVVIGRPYYEAVLENPATLMWGLQCEDLWDMPATVYERRFGLAAPSIRHSLEEEFPAEESEEEIDIAASSEAEFPEEDEALESDWASIRDDWDVSRFSTQEESHPPQKDEI